MHPAQVYRVCVQSRVRDATAARLRQLLMKDPFGNLADLERRLGHIAKRLGVFNGTSLMTWSRRAWFSRVQDFEDAARDVIESLAPRLEQSGLLEPVARS